MVPSVVAQVDDQRARRCVEVGRGNQYWRQFVFLVGAGDLVWHGEGALLTRPALQVQWAPASLGSICFLDACAQGVPLLDAAQVASEAEPDLDLSQLMAQLLDTGALQAP